MTGKDILRIWYFFTIFLLFPLISAGKKGSGAEIYINKSVVVSVVSNDVIKIGDIADIRGSDKEFIKKIAAIEVTGRLPRDITKPVTIRKKRLLARLRNNRIDMSSIYIESPEEITVKRKYTKIGKDRMMEVIKDFLFNRLMMDRENVVITGLTVDEINVPDGEMFFDISSASNLSVKQIPLTIKIFIDNRLWKTVHAKVFVDELKDIIVSARDVKRGEMIYENDIIVKRMSITGLRGDFLTDKEEVIGKQSMRDMKTNAVIKRRDVKDFYLLKNGDRVAILAETHLIKVSAKGIVKENGKKGDLIRVLNISSKRQIFAEVVDAQTVMVDF